MAGADWIEQEPGLVAALHELGRVLRRARRRWLVTLLIATSITGLLVVKLARKRPLYRARAILRVTEGAFADSRRSLRRGELQGYLANVVLSNRTLLPVIEDLGLYSGELELGEPAAVAAMREDLEVAVFRNFFLIAGAEERRSVRIAITYTGQDAAVATEIVTRLADAVTGHERQRQNRATDVMEREALREIDEADGELERRSVRIAEIAVALSTAGRGERSALRVEDRRLQAELQIYDLARGQARDKLAAAKAYRASPLAIELARLRAPEPISEVARRRRLVLVGGFGFVVLLPMAAIFVGAFDPRVRDVEDIERIGLPVVGHVPAFRGDGSGALRERLPGRRWWRRRGLSDRARPA